MAYASKWTSFVVAVYLQMVGGLCYTFSLYAGELKTVFGFSQTQLEGLGTALVSANGVIGWIPSLVYDHLRHRPHLGPRLTAVLGVGAHFIGYITIWAAAAGHISLPYPAMLALGVLASSTLATLDAACIGTALRNFPNERGHVAGIQKAFLGLTASVATSIYVALLQPSALHFLLFVALAPLAMGAATIPFLNYVPFAEKSETQGWWTTGGRFGITYWLVGALAVYQLAVAIAGVSSPLSHGQAIGAMIGTIAILGLNVFVPFTCGGWRGGLLAEAAAGQGLVGCEDVVGAKELLLPDGEEAEANATSSLQKTGMAPVNRPARVSLLAVEVESSLWQSLCSLNFWLLFLMLVVGMGTAQTFNNNVGELVEALGGGRERTPVLISIYSVMNCAGRMLLGCASEAALHRWRTPRTLFMALVAGYTALSCLFTAFSSLTMLYVATALAGLSTGSFWSLMTVLTSEVFGLANFGVNLSLMHIAPTLGSLLFATQLAGNLYQARAAAQGSANVCLGTACYRLTFLVLAACNVVSCLLGILLFRRTRYIYRKALPTPEVSCS